MLVSKTRYLKKVGDECNVQCVALYLTCSTRMQQNPNQRINNLISL